MAGDLNASGGGSNPSSPYPQGPRYDNGTGNLITGGKDFSGGGFFTGYWLTTGAPTTGLDVTGDGKADLYIGDTSPFSNAIFAGGWYTLTTKFSMTSGTSGVHVCPNPCTLNDIILEVDSPFNPANVGSIQSSGGQGDLLTYTYKVTNTGGAQLANVKVLDDNGTPGVLTDDFFAAAVKNANGNNYGDVNNNGLLDPNEIWYFQAKDYACHDFTNTATVTADVVPLVGVVQDTASASFHLVA